MKNIDRVKEFHETYACFINDKRSIDNFHGSLAVQRFNLISEEVCELIAAIGNDDRLEMLDALTDIDYVLDGTYLTFGMVPSDDPEWIEDMQLSFADGAEILDFQLSLPLAFLESVTYMLEAYLQSEIDKIEECLRGMSVLLDILYKEYEFKDVREAAGIEVHRSNMSKLSEDGKPMYRESDGKVMKGPNYFKPNLRQFINDDQRRNIGTGGTVR